jgi:hypothetical protein
VVALAFDEAIEHPMQPLDMNAEARFLPHLASSGVGKRLSTLRRSSWKSPSLISISVTHQENLVFGIQDDSPHADPHRRPEPPPQASQRIGQSKEGTQQSIPHGRSNVDAA